MMIPWKFMNPVQGITTELEVHMTDKKDLRGSIEKMRDVAQLLTGWADDLESSLESGKKKRTAAADKAPAAENTVAAPAEIVADTTAKAPAKTAKEAPTDKSAETTTTQSPDSVRAVLAAKCAAGYRAQVQALINSFGASKFSEVAPEHYPALLEAVAGLGGDPDAG